MKFLVIIVALLSVYVLTTESGKEMFDKAYSFVYAPVDKANAAADQMNSRNENMKNELDAIVDN